MSRVKKTEVNLLAHWVWWPTPHNMVEPGLSSAHCIHLIFEYVHRIASPHFMLWFDRLWDDE